MKASKGNHNNNQITIIRFLQQKDQQPQSSQKRKSILNDRLNAELAEPAIESDNDLQIILTEREKEIELLKSKINEQNKTIKILTQALDQAYKVVGKKEIAYHELQDKKFERNNNQNYCKFKEFNESTLDDLRSIAAGKSNDSYFVRRVVQALYEDNLGILEKRTAKLKTDKKDPITPKKKEIITAIFDERLTMEAISSVEKLDRECKLNRFIKNAIDNITKKK